MGNLTRGRGGLAVSASSYEATGPGSILGVFPGSGFADSMRSGSRGGYSCAIKMLTMKCSQGCVCVCVRVRGCACV